MTQTRTLQTLKDEFSAGQLSKPDFIRGALELHRQLFDYVGITRSTDVREISITPEGVSFLIGDEGIRLFAPPDEARVAPIEIMNFDHYEPAETQVMDLLTRQARRILDVGANIGWYAVRFAKRLPGAQVHAFEPMPQAHAYLQRNVAANGMGARIHCYNYGLSEANGSFEYFIAPTGGTNASLRNVAAAADARRIMGLTLTLDQWCANQQIQPDFIKCDVEGAELLVFRGGRETIARDRPIVFAELLRKWSKPFGYHPSDVLAFFSELGYACYAVGGAGVRRLEEVTDETEETNYAFVHREAHAESIALLESLK
ncbi:MAG: FkbM family methyltransferase [Paucibacter sp.]|nr:FkbM family methyltransferase [Roseateles sp.]